MAASIIPIIDVSAPDADERDIARQLVEAAADHGFIYIRNLGRDVGIDQVEGAFDISKTLFASSDDEKERCKMKPNNRGWVKMHSETLDPKTQRVGDFKEAFNFGLLPPDTPPSQPLPTSISPRAPEVASFWASCQSLCRRILYLLGLGLNVSPADFFSAAHPVTDRDGGTTLRLLYYPPHAATSADRSLDVRAGAHSDYGSITLLFRLRGQAGLELLTREGRWEAVPVCPPGTEEDPAPPILVNIGDLLSWWTNGLFRSTVHRVVFQAGQSEAKVEGESEAEPRYSIAFFCHPAGDTALEPVPSERVRSFAPPPGTPNAHEGRGVVTADEHLQMRLRSTYLDLYKDEVKV